MFVFQCNLIVSIFVSHRIEIRIFIFEYKNNNNNDCRWNCAQNLSLSLCERWTKSIFYFFEISHFDIFVLHKIWTFFKIIIKLRKTQKFKAKWITKCKKWNGLLKHTKSYCHMLSWVYAFFAPYFFIFIFCVFYHPLHDLDLSKTVNAKKKKIATADSEAWHSTQFWNLCAFFLLICDIFQLHYFWLFNYRASCAIQNRLKSNVNGRRFNNKSDSLDYFVEGKNLQKQFSLVLWKMKYFIIKSFILSSNTL